LCARDRLEAVARKNPKTRDELETIVELRQWQRAVLGESFLKALEHHRAARTA
jgi:ribonuclease D